MDVGHSDVQVGEILDDSAAIVVRLDSNAVVSAVEGAVDDGHVRNAAGSEAANRDAMTVPESAVSNHDSRGCGGAAADCYIVISNADVAVADNGIGLGEVDGISIVRRICRIRRRRGDDVDAFDSYVAGSALDDEMSRG